MIDKAKMVQIGPCKMIMMTMMIKMLFNSHPKLVNSIERKRLSTHLHLRRIVNQNLGKYIVIKNIKRVDLKVK